MNQLKTSQYSLSILLVFTFLIEVGYAITVENLYFQPTSVYDEGDYVYTNDARLKGSNSYTFAFRKIWHGFNENSTRAYLFHNSDSSNNDAIAVYIDSNEGLCFKIGGEERSSGWLPEIDTWYDLIITYNHVNGDVIFYKNGQSFSEHLGGSKAGYAASDFYIANHSTPNNLHQFLGELSSLQFFNTTMSSPNTWDGTPASMGDDSYTIFSSVNGAGDDNTQTVFLTEVGDITHGRVLSVPSRRIPFLYGDDRLFRFVPENGAVITNYVLDSTNLNLNVDGNDMTYLWNSYSPTETQFGVTITDDQGHQLHETITMVISDDAPVLLSPPISKVKLNEPFEYMIRSSDALNTGITYSIIEETRPIGLTLASNGHLEWTPTSIGEYQISIIATDSHNQSTQFDFPVQVTENLEYLRFQNRTGSLFQSNRYMHLDSQIMNTKQSYTICFKTKMTRKGSDTFLERYRYNSSQQRTVTNNAYFYYFQRSSMYLRYYNRGKRLELNISGVNKYIDWNPIQGSNAFVYSFVIVYDDSSRITKVYLDGELLAEYDDLILNPTNGERVNFGNQSYKSISRNYIVYSDQRDFQIGMSDIQVYSGVSSTPQLWDGSMLSLGNSGLNQLVSFTDASGSNEQGLTVVQNGSGRSNTSMSSFHNSFQQLSVYENATYKVVWPLDFNASSFSMTQASLGMTIDEAGLINYVASEDKFGSNNLYVTVKSDEGSNFVGHLKILVESDFTPDPPVFNINPVLNVTLGTEYSIPLYAADSKGSEINFSIVGTPSCASGKPA